ncbi:putative transcriptional regulator [Bradyrhizobium ottawaense]|uniref:hypothetical protein n=1 Tax=Bradyrhizobium ottawaense TaxID=931866 RepID=UPI0035165C7E
MATDKEYARRHTKAAAVSRMFLTCTRAMSRAYPHQKNVGQLLPDLLVIMAIRVNDQRRRCKPISISQIARVTGLPRTNVRRILPLLLKVGVIDKSDDGYVGDTAFLRKRIKARYFQAILKAVERCARELRGA